MMLRVLFSLLVFVSALGVMPAHALEIRSSRQDGYSRLVFDWGKPVGYSVTQSSPDTVVIRFNENASANAAALKAGSLDNILGASVVSTSPLEISLKISSGAKPRDFQAAGRIMVDIYDAPGARKPSPAKTEKKSAENKIEEKKPDPKKPDPKKSDKKKNETLLEPAPPAVKADVKPVVVTDLSASSATTGDAATAPNQDDLGSQANPKRGPIVSNLITLSSIEPVGLAVFSRDNKIWLVSDAGDSILPPQVSGPEAKKMLPVDSKTIDGGRVFTISALPDAFIKGQGGGLLWRIIVPAKPNRNPPVKAERIVKNEDDLRGGSVQWRFDRARRVFEIPDPVTGNKLFAVTVASARDYAGAAQKFVEFETLESPVGLTIVPKVDDLQVTLDESGVLSVTRPGGLVITSEEKLKTLLRADVKKIESGAQQNVKRIFDFKNWQLGGLEAIDENRNVIINQIGSKEGSEKAEGIMALAKMYLANGMWAEAKGFFDLAADEMPDLNQNASFNALVGATQALGWESEEAFKSLSNPELQSYPEIGYWRAFALAELGDWQQAAKAMPADLFILSDYPPHIRTKLALVLAEVVLREGNTAKGEELLRIAEDNFYGLRVQQKAAVDYLRGEAARQKNKLDDTKKLWKNLTAGEDDLYRTKAGLALTRLLVDKKEIPNEKGIDNLERLRYAWRGDELEAQVAYWLGQGYFDTKQFVKGLVIMREASLYAGDTDIGKRITAEMMQVFTKLFTGPDLDKIPAIEAAALYEKFNDIIPAGGDSDKITERLAERLVKADLLDKAVELLQGKVSTLDPANAYRVTVRLAAINLLDNKPVRALDSLARAQDLFAALPKELQTPDKTLEMNLLKARALSDQEKPDQALAMLKDLPRSPEGNRLRSDIAWHAAYWDAAAEALNDVIVDRDISVTRPLDSTNTALILQRAVALNLANDRVGLASIRATYMDAMAQTDKARIFEVVTRPRQSAALADRETLMGVVSEVDLFKDFLDGYRKEPDAAEPVKPADVTPPKPAVPPPTAQPEAAAAE
jgi:hypothetical protein